uniref:Leucine-rich repeat-containing N-terminal plant-type domain-containing protein n=1 Tax=Globisporangium ultimum (strain ATCC 200006 / CBS 805.95 / DAOM BR144) TaxID=431595 RepID=K3W5P6_GLOUD
MWGHSFGYSGFFGVGGKHFALLFLIREATETVLQSIQAYFLSVYAPLATDFTFAKWADKMWLTNLNNEFKVFFIQSWPDFLGRILFALTLLLCLDDVKLLAASSEANSIRNITNLRAIYLYNSTVLEWSESAALSEKYHPVIRQLTFISVNFSLFSNGTILPPGLLAPDFPQSVGTVYIAACGLNDLPPSLATIWPKSINMIFIRSAATSLPPVFLRMELMRLTLQYTRISQLPPELFEIPSLKWLEVNYNPLLSELPAQITSPSAILKKVNFEYTNVSVLPAWMTTARFRSQVAVQGGNTPFCKAVVSRQDAAMMPNYHCTSSQENREPSLSSLCFPDPSKV